METSTILRSLNFEAAANLRQWLSITETVVWGALCYVA